MARTSDLELVVDALTQPGPVLDALSFRSGRSPAIARASAVLDELTGRRAIVAEPGVIVQSARNELAHVDLSRLSSWLRSLDRPPSRADVIERFWDVFSPSTAGVLASWEDRVSQIRGARTVRIVHPPKPVVPDGVLFTANVLIGPAEGTDPGPPDFWYDHPVPLGARSDDSELVHGLTGLDQAVAFERGRGSMSRRARIVLSVSTTHRTLVEQATEDVIEAIERSGPYPNLEVFVLDEPTVRTLLDEVLTPAARAPDGSLVEIGVLGPYGRHYSFLKAIGALWQAALDPSVQATFKIDLDQVFPQRQLVSEFGRSAMESLAHPAWGAIAHDDEGAAIELGMLAGSLVDAADAGRGLLTPDVTSDGDFTPSDLVFCKRITQALSTEAEMMDDGTHGTRQRIHVTGGTTGIRIDALRRSWPFTPSFFGRAEDQAYQLATFDDPAPGLRTLHAPGVVMRHDAGIVARPSADREATRTEIADLERFLQFSAYARLLGLRAERLWPFTGAFISETPATIAVLRLALRTIELAEAGDERRAGDLLTTGLTRLGSAAAFAADSNGVAGQVDRERTAWRLFSVLMGEVERDASLAARVRAVLHGCRVGSSE